MWAKKATPPLAPKLPRPVSTCTTFLKPSTTTTGIYTKRKKKPRMMSVVTCAPGNRTR